MNSQEVKAAITKAFQGVGLNGGCSLREGKVADQYGQPDTAGPDDFPEVDITDDWTALSMETLEAYSCLSYMDAEGFRYYIPAFMLSVISRYEGASMRAIDTLLSLYPKNTDRWDYKIALYSALNREQKAAIAHYLHELPTLVELKREDQKVVERALRNYWHEFL